MNITLSDGSSVQLNANSRSRYPLYLQQNSVRAIPMNFLIDPDCKIIVKDLRGEHLGQKFDELLTENK
jgi:hypothetical protein